MMATLLSEMSPSPASKREKRPLHASSASWIPTPLIARGLRAARARAVGLAATAALAG